MMIVSTCGARTRRSYRGEEWQNQQNLNRDNHITMRTTPNRFLIDHEYKARQQAPLHYKYTRHAPHVLSLCRRLRHSFLRVAAGRVCTSLLSCLAAALAAPCDGPSVASMLFLLGCAVTDYSWPPPVSVGSRVQPRRHPWRTWQAGSRKMCKRLPSPSPLLSPPVLQQQVDSD